MIDRTFEKKKTFLSVLVTAAFTMTAFTAMQIPLAGLAIAANKGPSGLPLPRFVSLKSQRVNMRVGPGRDYHVEWMYTKRGLPLEILQEYDNWRKVRDSEGEEGWILQSLLSGERTALITPWKKGENETMVELRDGPSSQSRLIAKLEPGVLTNIDECTQGWCSISVNNIKGYTEQAMLWGVYPDEKVD